MGLYYTTIQPVPVFGTKSTAFALTPVALTATASDNRKIIDGTAGMSKFDLRYSYTTGAAETNNSLNIVIEESSDGTNWFTIANETVSAGTSTLNARTFVNAENTAAATNIKSSIGLDIFYDKLRVSVTESGVAANFGTIYAEASIIGK